MQNVFGEWADFYRDVGFNVIPLSGKRPKVSEWSKYCEQQSDDDVEALLAQWGQSADVTGIGLALSASLCAVDIDTDNALFLFQACEILSNGGQQDLTARKGAKGMAIIMRRGQGVETRKRTRGSDSEPFEIMCQGTQLVLPPSIHPETNEPYIWLPEEQGFTGDPANVDQLPTLTTAMVNSLVLLAQEMNINRATFKPMGDSVDLSIGGRNNHLTAMAWRKALEQVPLEQGATELYEFDRVHHNPPFFSDPSEPHNPRNPLENAKRMYTRAIKKLAKQEGVSAEPIEQLGNANGVIGPIDMGDDEPIGDPVATYQAQFDAIKENAIKAKELLAEGAFKDFRECVMSYNVSDAPMLCMGGAISLCSMWAANLFELSGTRANTFVNNIGPTGAGKSIPQTVISEVLSELHKVQPGRKQYWPNPIIGQFIGQGKYRGPSSIRFGLTRNVKHARFDIQDEVGDLYKRMTHNTSIMSIMDDLQKIWSASSTGIQEEMVADAKKTSPAISNPYIVWLGSTTMNAVQPYITKDKMAQGLIPRTLWMIDYVSAEERIAKISQETSLPFGVKADDIIGDDEEYFETDDNEDPFSAQQRVAKEPEALKRLRAATAYWIGKPPISNMTSSTYNSEDSSSDIPCVRLTLRQGAIKLLKEYEIEEAKLFQKLETELDDMHAMARRMCEQVRKLAIIYWIGTEGYKEALSGGEYKAKKVIEPQHILWGRELWQRMWDGFCMFMELDRTNLDSAAGVLQKVRQEALDWLSQQADPVKQSYLKRYFIRQLQKHDRANKIHDAEVCFEQTYKIWLKFGNVEVVTKPGSRLARVAFVSH